MAAIIRISVASSHITSDLEKIADYIVFIHEGKVVFEKLKDKLTERYGIIKCGAAQFDALDKSDIIAHRNMDYEWQILVSDRKKCRKSIRRPWLFRQRLMRLCCFM